MADREGNKKTVVDVTTDSLKESVIIVAAFLVILYGVQNRAPNWSKLVHFFVVFVPVVAALKYYHVDMSKSLVGAAGFSIGTQIFNLIDKP